MIIAEGLAASAHLAADLRCANSDSSLVTLVTLLSYAAACLLLSRVVHGHRRILQHCCLHMHWLLHTWLRHRLLHAGLHHRLLRAGLHHLLLLHAWLHHLLLLHAWLLHTWLLHTWLLHAWLLHTWLHHLLLLLHVGRLHDWHSHSNIRSRFTFCWLNHNFLF